MEEKFYIATVETVEQTEEGKSKKTSNKFLVSGFNVTDVEAKITKEYEGDTRDWFIKNVSDSKIVKVITNEE